MLPPRSPPAGWRPDRSVVNPLIRLDVVQEHLVRGRAVQPTHRPQKLGRARHVRIGRCRGPAVHEGQVGTPTVRVGQAADERVPIGQRMADRAVTPVEQPERARLASHVARMEVAVHQRVRQCAVIDRG
jgi:hypothetical protein